MDAIPVFNAKRRKKEKVAKKVAAHACAVFAKAKSKSKANESYQVWVKLLVTGLWDQSRHPSVVESAIKTAPCVAQLGGKLDILFVPAADQDLIEVGLIWFP